MTSPLLAASLILVRPTERICHVDPMPRDSVLHQRRKSISIPRLRGRFEGEVQSILETSAMASTTPSPTLNIRTPKLTYRTKSTDTSSFTSAATDSTRSMASAQPVSPFGTEISSLPSPQIETADTRSQYGSRRPSIATSSSSSSIPSTPGYGNKKRANFLAGLLSVKEPSAQALLEYQRQMKKQAPGAKGRISAVGLPGISSAQLPPTVPKVNSKWDGVPQPLKEKERKQQLAARKSLSAMNESLKAGHSEESVSSGPTHQLRRLKSRDTLGGSSTHSSGSQNKLADLYGWEISGYSSDYLNKDGAAENPRPSISTTNSSTQSAHSSCRPMMILTNPLEPPKPPQGHLYCPPKQQPDPRRPLDHAPSPNLAPTKSPPRSPSIGSASDQLENFVAEKTPSDSEISKTTANTSIDPTEEVKLYSSGANVLGPPASVTRHQMEAPHRLPIRTEAIDRTKPTSKVPDSHKSQKDAPASQANVSEIRSPQRRNSAQERLNLGMSLKHQAVPPWTWSEIHPETKAISNEGERTSSPSPKEGPQSLRKKRLTLFKK